MGLVWKAGRFTIKSIWLSFPNCFLSRFTLSQGKGHHHEVIMFHIPNTQRMVFENNIWLIFTYTFRSGTNKNGNLPKFWRWKVKVKHIWNHHLVNHVVQWFRLVVYFSLQKRNSTVKIASISETPTLNKWFLEKYSSYFSPSNLSPKLPSCSKTSCRHPNHHSISFLHLNVSGIPGGIPLLNNHFQVIQAVPFSSPSWRSV